MMPELFSEIFYAIVDQFDAAKKQDRETLRRLLFVSQQLNSLALPALYQHVLLSRGDYHEDLLIYELGLLARYAEDNPGLRFTTAFSFLFSGEYWDDFYYNIHEPIKRIMCFLPNVRRVQIAVENGPVHARILRTLPSSAPITHLRLSESSLSSDDLRDFIESHPTLQWLQIYSRQPKPSEDVRITAGSLPSLRCLSIPAWELAYLQDPLPLLTNLEVGLFNSLTDVVTDHMATRFASIVSCVLSDTSFANIASFISNLPNLEYLYVKPLSDSDADDGYNALSATKLKYLECFCFASRPEAARTLGLRMFDIIKTLVVVDVTLLIIPTYHTMRLYNGQYHGIVYHPSGPWRRWWEDAERAVELAGRLPASESRNNEGH